MQFDAAHFDNSRDVSNHLASQLDIARRNQANLRVAVVLVGDHFHVAHGNATAAKHQRNPGQDSHCVKSVDLDCVYIRHESVSFELLKQIEIPV
jgi:hypothetical protein